MTAATLGVALVLALAACSSGGGEPAFDVLSAASTKTAEAGSTRMSMTMTLDTEDGRATMTGEGMFDLGNGRGTMRMTYGPGFGPLTGASMESISDGTVMYMKFPPEMIPSSKPWVRLDLQQAGAAAGIDIEALQQAQQNDPTQFLQYLKGVSKDVRTVGKEDVRGEPTTHYRATIDFRQAAEAMGPEARSSIDAMIEQLGTTKMPAEYWVDEEGRIRRTLMSLDLDGNGPQPPTEMTYELYDFGAPVEIAIPPANQVVDFTELLRTAPR